MMSYRNILLIIAVLAAGIMAANCTNKPVKFFAADNANIQYTGRIDFSNPKLPRFWQPGVYITAKFTGKTCKVILNDEVLWGKNHNYLEIVVDGVEKRIQTKSAHDTISVAEGLREGTHTLIISKNTEANIGYLELVGFLCESLVEPDAKPGRKMEFIGNSITCGTGADASEIPCGKGVWQDQHNAYLSYGAITARGLNAQYHLSSVSGIGLMHSCCNMDILMPQVYDKISLRNDTIQWDFKNYQPDVVSICLGQNDGVQDSTAFTNSYVSFIKELRNHYPSATFILLSSPMADNTLRKFMSAVLPAVEKKIQDDGDEKIHSYIFNEQYSSGCDSHPDLKEHRIIANQLSEYIRMIMKW